MADITMTPEMEQIIAEKVAEATKGLYTEETLNKKVTSEVDRRVESGIQKGLETQKSKWELEYAERAKLTAEELANKEYNEKLEAFTAKEKDIAKKSNNIEAKEMLSEAQIPKSHYSKFINMLVSDDVEATKSNVQNFIDMFNSTKLEIETNVKSTMSTVPKPEIGTVAGVMTKSDFNKLGYADKLKFKASNPEMYKEFLK